MKFRVPTHDDYTDWVHTIIGLDLKAAQCDQQCDEDLSAGESQVRFVLCDVKVMVVLGGGNGLC